MGNDFTGITSMLEEWYGQERGRAEVMRYKPHLRSLSSTLDLAAQRLLGDTTLAVAELRDSWEQLTGKDVAKMCTVSYISGRTVYIEVRHPAYRLSLDTLQIRTMLLEKIATLAGEGACREIRFIPGGRNTVFQRRSK